MTIKYCPAQLRTENLKGFDKSIEKTIVLIIDVKTSIPIAEVKTGLAPDPGRFNKKITRYCIDVQDFALRKMLKREVPCYFLTNC